MKPSPPTETNDSCSAFPAGVIVFGGSDVHRSSGDRGRLFCALVIRWVVKGPPPPPPPWGTRTDDERDGESNDRG